MIGSLRRLAQSALAMARTRLELAGLELAQERDRLLQVALFGFLGVIALGVALLCGTAARYLFLGQLPFACHQLDDSCVARPWRCRTVASSLATQSRGNSAGANTGRTASRP